MLLNRQDERRSLASEETKGTFAITDLAEMLTGANGPEVAAAILARFEAAGERLSRKMQAGVSPADFAAMAAVLEALHQGRRVLQIAERAARPGVDHQASRAVTEINLSSGRWSSVGDGQNDDVTYS